MIKRVFYYLELAWHDLIRLRSATCLQAIIVAGVCFPILILLAVKRGHVADLREDLETSPTGRLVKVGPASAGQPFTLVGLRPLADELGTIDIAYPWAKHNLDISAIDEAGKERIVEKVELHASCPGDPMLIAQEADVLQEGERLIVLYKTVASLLKVKTGNTVTLHIEGDDTAPIDFVVKAIVPPSKEDLVGFVDSVCIDRFKRFRMGASVPEWNLPSRTTPPAERYPVYLLVNDATDPLRPADFDTLVGYGFKVEKTTDASEVSLGGAIAANNLDKVVVYRLTRTGSGVNIDRRMTDDLSKIGKTLATDAAIPWCQPRSIEIDGKQMQLVGLTLPPRCRWLHKLLIRPNLAFEKDDSHRQCRILSGDALAKKTSVVLSLASSVRLKLEVSVVADPESGEVQTSDTSAAADSPSTVFVPAKLLAYLDEYQSGTAAFESQTGQLTSIVADPTYEDAILFARTIDDVPKIVANALLRDFPFDAENARIDEIKKQTGSLSKLVWVVAALVFGFGILTVLGVLWESTARKRSVVGIMRVMGVTPGGAFLIVTIRALILGGLAGVVTVFAGWLCVVALTWDPAMDHFNKLDKDDDKRLAFQEFSEEASDLERSQREFSDVDKDNDDQLSLREYRDTNRLHNYKFLVSAVLVRKDLFLVLVGSVVCCMVGSFAPALSAARLDPFDALIQGRFR